MAKRKIVSIGDERLRQKAKKVKQFSSSGLKQLAQDMLETMRHHKGVGLAGPQIGVMHRIFVAEIPLPEDEDTEPLPHAGKSFILINPKILKSSESFVEGEEGCLSIPQLRGLVNRSQWVDIKAQDIDGRKIRIRAEGLLARIFLHEIDHLDGVLFADHITDAKKLWRVETDEEPLAANVNAEAAISSA